LLAFALAEPARGGELPPANPRFTGTPLLRLWQTEDYHAAEQNWRITVAPNGLVYVANNDGVLEFDGERWRLIPLPRQGAARALAADIRGRIWVGAHEDICRLEPDAQGQLQAISVLGQLPAPERAVGTVSRALATADGVYLRSRQRLIFFGLDDHTRVWPAPDTPGILWQQDGAVYAKLDSLARIDATGATPVPLVSDSRDALPAAFLRIFASQRSADGQWLLLTSRGPARWAGAGHPMTPLRADTAALFDDDLANSGCFLPDGRYAFGTDRTGLLVFSATGELEQKIDRAHGLPSTRVNDLAPDAEGGLWLALDNGVVRLALDSPFALHGAAQGLTAGPRYLAVLGDRLYVAHREGVSRRDPLTGRFVPIDGFQVGVNRLLALDGRLLAGTRGLLEILPDDKSTTWTHVFGGPMAAAQQAPGWIFVGSSLGLDLVAPDATTGGWRQKPVATTLTRNLDELLDSGNGYLWAVDLNGAVLRADFRAGGPAGAPLRTDPPVRIYGPEDGIPSSTQKENAKVFPLGGETYAGGATWLRRYDPGADRFVPESRFPQPGGIASCGTGPAGDVWLQFSGQPEALEHLSAGPGGWRRQSLAISPLRGLRFEHVFEEPSTHTLWLAAQGALVSADLAWRPAGPLPPLRVNVRRVETAARELLFAGATRSGDPANRLAWQQSALRFTFAAATYEGDHEGREHTLYRTRLTGLDSDWTPWTEDTVREFTNLPYRRLTFQVQARARDGRESTAAEWTFSVTPPWWYAPWAFAAYAVLAAGALAGYVRLRTRHLQRRAAQLEETVAARTDELRRSNLELARLHRLELDEKTAARFAEEKARLELLRYQLNPHFLLNAFTTLRGLVFTQPESAGDMLARLAEFCRFALTRTDGNGGTVADEAQLIESYLATEKARWRDELACSVTVDPAVAATRLPPFLLQPLVENAVKYGGRTSPDRLEVRVSISGDETQGLRIEVANTGAWVEAGSAHHAGSTGVGLDNLRQRLRRYYPDCHTLDVDSSAGRVRVRLHLQQPARDPFAPAHPAH